MDEYAARLLRDPRVEEVVVFGSFARGNYAPGSDIDVLVLLNHAEGLIRDRIPEFLPGAFPVGVDLFPYTREELESLAPSPILDAVRDSRWRYRRQQPAAGSLPK
jgi:predicted nucleotidyltransferase